jgi:pimeloyl-ACP methyl ester carboxylesterase
MSTFGLVHGGGFGAWCWERLLPELSARRLPSATVDLSPEDFAEGAAHCAEIIDRELASVGDLILVSHSLAGLITPIVATRRPVSRLIFLHSLLPKPGQSVLDQLTEEADMFNPEMLAATAPFWEDEAVAMKFLLHDCPADVARGAFLRLRPESGALGREVSPLRDWPRVPCAYIVCTEDRTATPTWARRVARERLAVEPVEIRSGHCPFLSHPRELVSILEQCL